MTFIRTREQREREKATAITQALAFFLSYCFFIVSIDARLDRKRLSEIGIIFACGVCNCIWKTKTEIEDRLGAQTCSEN